MSMRKQVKKRVALLATMLAALPAFAQQPTAQEILKTARLNQSEQHQALRGRLRTGATVIPFRLVMDGNEMRYEFTDPAQVLRLRFGDKSSRLEEITRDGAERVTAARFDQTVRNTNISYEDLTLHFLYWPDGEMLGEDTQLTRRCWKLRLRPVMDVWIEQQSGALLEADAYDWNGKLAKRFKVISAQKIEGAWLLKQMRIEAMEAGKSKEKSPTYLEIQGVEK
jgi:hypothetical protein